jgi:hypothetical protein
MKYWGSLVVVLALWWLTAALAAEQPAARAPLPPRVPEMSAAGQVLEISETHLKIERTLKGKAETMELVLESPLSGITAGDQVKISYRQKEGRSVLTRIAPAKMTAVKKGKEPLKPVKPVPPAAPPNR